MTVSPSQQQLLGALLKQRRPMRTTVEPMAVSQRTSPRMPMSSAQQRLWILEQSSPLGGIYLIPAAYRVSGPLDIAALTRALNEIVARHESLRTRFGMDGATPVQIIAEHLPINVDVIDAVSDVDSAIAAECAMPMDLTTGPLLRARLLRTAPQEHVLLLTMHHIVADEWSMDVLHRELSALYRGESLPPLPVQAADVAVWQREWLAGPEGKKQIEFWKSALDGAPAFADLPADRPRPPVQSFAGASLPVALGVTSAQVEALADTLGVTKFTVLLTAYQVLLSRLTGQDDVVCGTPVTSRNRRELAGLIGFFVETMAVRADLSDNPPFATAVTRVSEMFMQAGQGGQQVPFDAVVQAARPQRDPSRSPLFQTMFVHQARTGHELELAGTQVSRLRAPVTTAKFDLTLVLGDDLTGEVEYATDLFDEATVRRFVSHLDTLLAVAIADPTTAVGLLPILTREQHHELVHTFNQVAPVADPAPSLQAMFAAAVQSGPDRLAIVHEGGQLTYAQLDKLSDAGAHELAARGVGRGSLVALQLPRGADLVVAILATLKAGAAYVPIDVAQPLRRINMLLDDIAPATVVDAALSTTDADFEPVMTEPDDLAYIIYTSGSTGRPKGVQVTQAGVVNYATWARQTYGVVAGGAGAPVHSSATFDLTVTSMLVPLLSGSTVRLLAQDAGPAGLGEALGAASEPFELVKITPAHLELVARQLTAEQAAGRTNAFVIGGENLLAAQIAHWRQHAPGTRLFNEYGPTETVVGCAIYEVTEETPHTGSVPIGRPIAGMRLYVLDGHMQPVPVGVPGELYIGGVGVARGYLNRPELTAERFVDDPFVAGQRLYRSGDIVRHRSDGNLEYLHRSDGQVKLRGFRIELGEIEAVLVEHGASAAAVVLREDTPGDQRLTAYVTGVSDVEALRRACLASLPDYMVPAAIRVLETIPLTANGKVNHAALPAPLAAKQQPLSGDTAQLIAAVWRELLGVESIGMHDNFFEAGGHSLLLLAVHTRLVAHFPQLTVTDLFRHPTIDALTRRLTVQKAAPVPEKKEQRAYGGAIAIVAMACRFPDASTPDEFWANIEAGRESVREFTAEEALADGADPLQLTDPHYVTAGTVLNGLEEFDATLFDYTPREAQILDPGHRLFLECAWEALELAGSDPNAVEVGVFAGSGRSNYFTDNLLTSPGLLQTVGEYQLTLSTDKDFLPTRTSYKLNLRGPSISVNTACSTSLVAVHMARLSLLAGECDVAIAGGASVMAAQRRGYQYQVGGIGSPDGHCRPFDAQAAGTIGSSGVGVVVLKRLEDAIAAGDTVLAVVRGSAVNNDGALKVGYTAPGVDGQAEVIRKALANAHVSARDIGLIEAHGTGTTLGDPIEVAALAQVYARETVDRQFCAIGSVKANIGHTDSAAGIAGLIKVVQALRHETLPPSVNFSSPNPQIDFTSSPFYVTTECLPWTVEEGKPRRAGVSSFGMGGTNAHLIIEQAPPSPAKPVTESGQQLLTWSARTATAADAMTERLGAHLCAHPDIDLAVAADMLRRGRRALPERRIAVVTDTADAIAALSTSERIGSGTATGNGGIALLFPGQGAQYAGMAAGLYRAEPRFRSTVDHCAGVLEPVLGLDLRNVLFGGLDDRLHETWLTQPALFTVEYALARLLQERGVEPVAMAGHSIGEYVAACLAGVFEVDDALRLVAARGRLVQDLPGGAMLALPLTEEQVAEHLDDQVCLAAINAARQTVVSGPYDAIDRLERDLNGAKRLQTSHAFHSSMLDPILELFAAIVARVPRSAPLVPYLSNLTGTWITSGQATDPDYWAQQLRRAVRFADAAAVIADQAFVSVECGPGRVLSTLVRQAGARPGIPIGDGESGLLEAIGRIWLTGAEVDWARFAGNTPPARIALPTYPFERKRHWISPGRSLTAEPVVKAITVAADNREAQVIAIWQDLLGIDGITPDDDFFMLGGNSLVATQLMSRLRVLSGVDVPLETVFANSTVAAMARALPQAATIAAPVIKRVSREGLLPVSYAQRRMWFMDQAHEQTAAYMILLALELDGELDLTAMKSALTALAERHESMRTLFPAPDGEPMQVILPTAAAVELPVIVVDSRDEALALLQAKSSEPFDLATGPLWRPVLVRYGANRHVLTVFMHHIIGDGWSLTLLGNELGELYTASKQDRVAQLPPLSIQYADFATWQREQSTQDGMTHWRERLGGAPTTVDFPTDRPRPAQQSFAGATTVRVLPAELAKQVRAVGQQRGATLYMTLLAALQALVFRHTRQPDLCIGSPVAGRLHAEVDRVVGCFPNTLVMRSHLDMQMAFTELLAQVRATALGAYAHQDVPFERIVDELNLPRDLSRNPLFQIMFNLLNTPKRELAFDGMQAEWLTIEAQTSQVDMTLYVVESDNDELRCLLEYNTDLFDAETMAMLLGRFEAMLRGITADPAATLGDLPAMPADELHQQLYTWNTTDRELPARNVHQMIAEQAARTPEAIAVTFGDLSLSYRELVDRAGGLAAYLKSVGVQPDTLVAVAMERSQEMVIAALGVVMAGAAYVPLDPGYPLDRQEYVLAHSGTDYLIVGPELADRYPSFTGHLIVGAEPPVVLPPINVDVEPLSLAYVIFTSGSTGRPKGVEITHECLVNYVDCMRREPGMSASDTMIGVSSFAFDMSVTEIFLPLITGARLVIASKDETVDAEALAALMDREGATFLQATPATHQLLLASGWAGRQELTVMTGGAPLLPALAEQLLPKVGRLWNLYGPTETTVFSTAALMDSDAVHVGGPIANTQIYLLDEGMRAVPTGATGEVYIGGLGVARGYLRQPDMTAERFVRNPFVPGTRMYRSGDLGRYRRDGTIDIVGRNDSQVKVRGFRIELGEVESVLAEHDAVYECAVIVRDDSLLAYLSLHDGHEPADWREHLRRKLPDYMIPAVFTVMEALPHTPNAKIDRKALPDPDTSQRMAGAITPPRTPLERTLAEHWAKVLGLDAIGIDDNFFDTGGDSFKAVKAVRGVPGITAGVLDLFKNPTVRAFATFLGSDSESDGRLLHRLTPQRTHTAMTLVCLPFAGGTAITYQGLATAVVSDVTLYALQAPAHDISEVDAQFLPFSEIVARAAAEVREVAGSGPVVLYGHCMGGALTIALAKRLEDDGVNLVRVLVGGHFPVPRLPGLLPRLMRKLLPLEKRTSKRQMLEWQRAQGFFSEELTDEENDFLMRVMLRDAQDGEDFYTDFYAEPDPPKVKAPFVSVVGSADRATELYQERHLDWSDFAENVSLEVIPHAGHYFQKHQPKELAEIIVRSETKPTMAARPATNLKTFMAVAFGQFISLIGTGLTTFAMGLWVYQQTGSISMFALTAMLALLPAVALAPIAGALADRWDRRKIIMLADTFAACGTVTLATLLWTGRLELWHIFPIVTVGAIANAFQQPSYMAAITQLVPKRYYGRANGFTQLGGAAGTILAPLLGGALVAAIGLSGVVLIDLVTFCVAISITLAVRFPNAMFVRREESFGKEILGGWRYIARRPGFVAIIAFTAVLNFFFGMVEVLATPLTLSLAQPKTLGLVLAATGAGLLTGSIAMSFWGGTARRTIGIIGSFVLIGLSMVVIGLYPHPAFPAAGLFGLGLATAFLNAHWLSIVQAKVGLELQGRVIATTIMGAWAMVPIGFLSAGPLVDALGSITGATAGRSMAMLVMIAGGSTVLLGLSALRYRRVRLLEDELPDVIPDAVVITDKDQLQADLDRAL